MPEVEINGFDSTKTRASFFRQLTEITGHLTLFGSQPLSATAQAGGVSDTRASFILARGRLNPTRGDDQEELALLHTEDLLTRRSV